MRNLAPDHVSLLRPSQALCNAFQRTWCHLENTDVTLSHAAVRRRHETGHYVYRVRNHIIRNIPVLLKIWMAFDLNFGATLFSPLKSVHNQTIQGAHIDQCIICVHLNCSRIGIDPIFDFYLKEALMPCVHPFSVPPALIRVTACDGAFPRRLPTKGGQHPGLARLVCVMLAIVKKSNILPPSEATLQTSSGEHFSHQMIHVGDSAQRLQHRPPFSIPFLEIFSCSHRHRVGSEPC